MAEVPDNFDVAAGFVAARSADLWRRICDVELWPEIFPGWIAAIEADDDHWRVTGPAREKYDFHVTADAEHRALDIEVVDELASADTLRLRVMDIPGGSLVVVAHGRLAGTSDAAWEQKRCAVADGLFGLSES